MNFSRSSLLFLTLGLFLALFLTACAGSDSEGGDLIIANSADAVSLDPAGSNDVPSSVVQQNIYESLTKQDGNMDVQPSLATEWEAIEDDLWEFTLREGVKFHDGTDFNADAVVANIERILDPDVGSPRLFLYEMITKVEAIDEHTVQFTTEFPFAPLPAHLAHSGGGMVSVDLIKEDYAAMEDGKDPGSVINEGPIGTGYFKFDEWQPGEYVRVVKNDDYWDDHALLDSVTFKVVPEDGTRIAELTTGDSHVTSPVSPSDVEQVNDTDGISVQQQGSVSLSYIGFNMDKAPFDDERVRQAVSMAIDKDQILDGIYDGFGVPAIGPIPPDVFGFDDSVSGLGYDVEKAKQLLADAGYEDGFSTTLWTNDSRERIDTAVNVQAQLKEIGIEVKVEELEWGAYLEQTANGEHDMFVLGWSTATGDADYAMYALFHSKNLGDPGNRTFTDVPELDELLDKGRQTPGEEERLEIYREAQELLVDIAPMLYIHHSEYLLGVSDKVKGLEQLPTQLLLLKDVYIEE